MVADMSSQVSLSYSMTHGYLDLNMNPSEIFAPTVAAVVVPQSAVEDRLELRPGGVIVLQPEVEQ
jgi:hypothetical protein